MAVYLGLLIVATSYHAICGSQNLPRWYILYFSISYQVTQFMFLRSQVSSTKTESSEQRMVTTRRRYPIDYFKAHSTLIVLGVHFVIGDIFLGIGYLSMHPLKPNLTA